MGATLGESVSLREGFVAELADAALEEVSRHHVGGSSIEQELGLWKALSQVVARCALKLRSAAPRPHGQCDNFVAELADAAYGLALAYGFSGAFVDVHLGLWKALRRAIRESRQAELYLRSLCPRAASESWREQPFRRQPSGALACA